MIVKGFRAIITKELMIGSMLASRASLVSFLNQVGKPITKTSLIQITRNKDRMNFEVASKVCNPAFTSELKGPGELGTRRYLEMLHHLDTAYINTTTAPRERIFSAWFPVFFIRLWNIYLKRSRPSQNPAAFNATMRKNFISTNLAAGIELNGHTLLIFHNKCRDMGRPELFLPNLLNSQHNERTFRSWRSLSTVRSTIVNMDIKEVMDRSSRLQVIEEAPSTISEFFTHTHNTKPKQQLVPEELLSDVQISQIVLSGFESAGKVFSSFVDLNENEMPRIQLNRQSAWISNAELKKEDGSDAELEEDLEEKEDNRLRLQAERDEAFMSNLDYLVAERGLGKLVEVPSTEQNTSPPNFICFSREGTIFYIKKSTLIWWLSAEGKRVSPDRVWRFIDDREHHSDGALQTGDFVEMKRGKKKHVVQILAFRFVDGKTFYGDRYENRDRREVEALCNFFEFKDGLLIASGVPLSYVNVKNCKNHVFLKRDLATGHLRQVSMV